jgi:hypothetical protein
MANSWQQQQQQQQQQRERLRPGVAPAHAEGLVGGAFGGARVRALHGPCPLALGQSGMTSGSTWRAWLAQRLPWLHQRELPWWWLVARQPKMRQLPTRQRQQQQQQRRRQQGEALGWVQPRLHL